MNAADTSDDLIARLLASISSDIDASAPPRRVALSGLQGSGKSTLAARLHYAANAAGMATVTCSLDDFYLPRERRLDLARTVHPLLATRGVPGTHDVDLLMATIDALDCASADKPAWIPRFDKGRDDRLSPAQWTRVDRPPQLLLFEGWCVGVDAQHDAALDEPINALEREADADGRWRRWVNQRLRDDYAPLWRRFDRLVVLQAPSFDVVTEWREQAEQPLRDTYAPHAMDAVTLRRFVAHYERLSRHALATLPARADVVLRLDRQRQIVAFDTKPR